MANLAALKNLDLPELAARYGYQLSERSSSNSLVMKRDSDHILLKRDGDHWVFCTVGARPGPQGSAIDFIMSEEQCDFHCAVLKLDSGAMAQWDKFPLPTDEFPSSISGADSETARQHIESGWNRSYWRPVHPYLLSRGLPSGTLNDSRFLDCWRVSSKGYCLFPYREDGALTGLEIRGAGVKVFSKGGKKSLWTSGNLDAAARVVICESPIDCLSFHALYGGDATDALWPLAYVAFGGGLGKRQRALLAELLATAAHRQVIVAVDNDAAGTEYFDALSRLSPVALERWTPVAKDVNADLVAVLADNGTNGTNGTENGYFSREPFSSSKIAFSGSVPSVPSVTADSPPSVSV
ncbi:MAG: toprim domain-containing protein [Candidatus Competibacteraceae bacterium]|nr:toprim domain-containing protein [Candidatus Competibacteraceae bacterium]MCB1820699.1 toprim domain-containing protein [Candidatus Competibacteraceae bacterium]